MVASPPAPVQPVKEATLGNLTHAIPLDAEAVAFSLNEPPPAGRYQSVPLAKYWLSGKLTSVGGVTVTIPEGLVIVVVVVVVVVVPVAVEATIASADAVEGLDWFPTRSEIV